MDYNYPDCMTKDLMVSEGDVECHRLVLRTKINTNQSEDRFMGLVLGWFTYLALVGLS